jgi:alpha-ribazole phosphatase
MKTVYLVRHGEVEEKYQHVFRGITDCELSEKGKELSQENVLFFKKERVELVISTGLKRTEYLGGLLQKKGVRHIVDRNFQEFNFGLCEGKSWEEIENEFPVFAQSIHSENISYPEGESMQDVLVRVKKGWEDLLTYPESRIVIVAHAGSLGCLLSHITHAPLSGIQIPSPGSVLKVTVEEENISISMINETARR